MQKMQKMLLTALIHTSRPWGEGYKVSGTSLDVYEKQE
jgi:hypothetical protein